MVPKALRLVAALAVSGTALYLVYGYNRKKAFVNIIRRGKGSLRLEYRHPNAADIQQPKQAQQEKQQGAGGGGGDGKQMGIVDAYCHHLPCLLRTGALQHPEKTKQPPLLLLAADPAEDVEQDEAVNEEESLKERLVKCEADATLVKALHNTLASYTVGEQRKQEVEEPLRNFSAAVSWADQASESDSLDLWDSLSNNNANGGSSAAVASSRRLHDSSPSDVPSSSSSSSEEDCCTSSKALLLSTVASSSASSSSSYTLAGCFSNSGDRKSAGKQKKVVRFSPSVAEPSSNNQDYRRRFKAQIAQRAVLRVHQNQRTQHGQPSDAAAVRSIAYDRPRLYSQAARQTITYSMYRTNHQRYCGRSHQSGPY